MEIKNWIDDIVNFEQLINEMKKVGENYIKSPNAESRFLADWIYRFAQKVDSLRKAEI